MQIPVSVAVIVGQIVPFSCTLPLLVLEFGYDKSATPPISHSMYPFLVACLIATLFPSPLFVVSVGAKPSSENTFPFIPFPEGFTLPTFRTLGVLPCPVVWVREMPQSETTTPSCDEFNLPTCNILGSWLPPPHVLRLGLQPSGL